MASRAPMLRARVACTSSWLIRREWRIGTSDSDSTPPAMIASACPRTIWSCAAARAWPADAQARLRV